MYDIFEYWIVCNRLSESKQTFTLDQDSSLTMSNALSIAKAYL